MSKPKTPNRVRSSELVVPRVWIVDGIEMPDHAIVELARDYGYGGDSAEGAAEVMKAWNYEVAFQA